MKSCLLFSVCVLLLFPVTSDARTWLVRQDGTGDCTTIQACISSADPGDSVLVGPGAYIEHLVIAVPITLVGELGALQTTIDVGDTGYRCITCSHPSGRVYISGFKITRGGPPEPYPNNYAGGILCITAELEVRDCNISYNFGGGVGCRPGSTVTIINCDILDNHGELGDPYNTPGNGILGFDATGIVTDCRITGSWFSFGVEWSGGQLELGYNEIYGGAGCVTANSPISTSIHHNLVRDANYGIAVGRSLNVSVENNTVIGIRDQGYGLEVYQCAGSVANNIVVSGSYYGVICSGTVTLSCNDVWNNAWGNYVGTCSHPTDISLNPLFCDSSSGNYYLNSSSPCANAPGCGQIGAFGVACGPTSVQETTWGHIKSLYR